MEVWEHLIDRYGLPLGILAGVLFFLWKWVLPFLKERITAAEAALKEQVAESRAARKEDQAQFLAALANRDKVNEEHTRAIRQLTAEIKGRPK
jgi:F0F1-type ATP synthase membrane subunit b/b'